MYGSSQLDRGAPIRGGGSLRGFLGWFLEDEIHGSVGRSRWCAPVWVGLVSSVEGLESKETGLLQEEGILPPACVQT